MATIRPRRRSLSEVKAKLLSPATTSHFQVMIGDPRQARDFAGGEFTTYLARQGLTELNRGGLPSEKRDKLNLMCSDTSLPGSNFATTELLNDYTGITERHVHRRVFDDRIDLTFYCDAVEYLPIRYFEAWMQYIGNEKRDNHSEEFYYRMRFPQMYKGSLEITKFEKNIEERFRRVNPLTYTFINAYPISIASMPVTYDASSLLKCTVSFTYSRYSTTPANHNASDPVLNAPGQAQFNFASFAGGLTNMAVDRLTRNDLLGDIAGGVVEGLLR
tara:strand:- start:734 stop:1555 length:822 start_codon:yes stop_codon:yes gene_type:complete